MLFPAPPYVCLPPRLANNIIQLTIPRFLTKLPRRIPGFLPLQRTQVPPPFRLRPPKKRLADWRPMLLLPAHLHKGRFTKYCLLQISLVLKYNRLVLLPAVVKRLPSFVAVAKLLLAVGERVLQIIYTSRCTLLVP